MSERDFTFTAETLLQSLRSTSRSKYYSRLERRRYRKAAETVEDVYCSMGLTVPPDVDGVVDQALRSVAADLRDDLHERARPDLLAGIEHRRDR